MFDVVKDIKKFTEKYAKSQIKASGCGPSKFDLDIKHFLCKGDQIIKKSDSENYKVSEYLKVGDEIPV